MKTDDLIALISVDARGTASQMSVAARLTPAALIGAVAALALLVGWLGMRDMTEAMVSPSYWMKTAYTVALAGAGLLTVERLSRPAASARRGIIALICVTAVMVALAITQLLSLPAEQAPHALLGSTWDRCPWRIAVLAIPGLVLVLLAMRRLAPTRPALAGAGAGLFVGAIAATIYGLYCAETSAVFTLIWYTGGIAIAAVLGALAGARVLRW